jgi:hypothetical protein
MGSTSPARGRRRRRLLIALAALVVVLGVLAVVTGTATSFQTYEDSSAPPDWSSPCFSKEPRHDRVLLAPCARATGFVTYVRAKGHQGGREVHFALVGRFGALIVKLDNPFHLPTPGIGSRVTVVGPLVRAQNGMREIEARSVE